jgi:hypothetical protein
MPPVRLYRIDLDSVQAILHYGGSDLVHFTLHKYRSDLLQVFGSHDEQRYKMGERLRWLQSILQSTLTVML